MAREYARIRLSIWADSDFRKLSDPAQALYFRLLSSPTMSLCGVADWRPNRLAALTKGMTPAKVEKAADELRDNGYIVTDDATEEVLVRSFVRHDGLVKTPNIAASMAKDYAGTFSEKLRGVIIHELQRLYSDDPEMAGWSRAEHLLSEPSINPSGNPSSKASRMASPNPSGEASDTGSDIPHPSSLNQQPSSSSGRKRAATSAPDIFPITDEMRTKAAEKYPLANVDRETEKFLDHHRAKGSTFKDWNAAWRTWMANAQGYAERDGRGYAQPQQQGSTSFWDKKVTR